ncbi:MFS transporter [Flavobacterium sp.]|jgi:hypothetical protein|uniref:MFS transporter n=1 Tax=Flavobacterium sp. TaxID=239 RepID=UPI002A83A702|nr:MFS transporter [Flavobacterium sp.]
MQQKLKTLKIIHLAICSGVLLAYVILGQITSLDALKLPTIDNDAIIYLIIPFAAFSVSNLLFKMQLKNANPKLTLEENLPVYQTASIIRWVILEGAALVLLILKKEFILFGILLILYLITIHPTEDRIKRDLNKSTS